MARNFVSASSQKAQASGVVSNAPPITMACWFKAANDTAEHPLIGIADNGSANNYFFLSASGSIAGDPVRCHIRSASGNPIVETTTGYTAGVWHHACAVYAAVDDRRVYIDGGSKATEATSITPTGIDNFTVGALVRSTTTYADADIAEVALWDVALTDAEIASLATRVNPTTIRPYNLRLYVPLIGKLSPEPNFLAAGDALNLTNTPVAADHPNVRGPARSWFPSIAGGTLHTVSLTGALASTASLVRQTDKALTGALAETGAIAKVTSKPLAGTLTETGALATLLTQVISLAGTVAFAGALANQAQKALTGALASSGALTKSTSKGLAGTLAETGGLVNAASKALTGALATAGAVTKSASKALTGTLTTAGALTAGLLGSIALAGTVAFSGVLTIATFGRPPFPISQVLGRAVSAIRPALGRASTFRPFARGRATSQRPPRGRADRG